MISGAVLAGGASRRMGRDKAMLPLDGEPMAARIARVLQEAGAGPVLIAGRQPQLATLGWPVVWEPSDGERHPLTGVANVLNRACTPLVLFAPCDLPGLQAHHLQRLLAFGQPCVARSSRVHPLVALLPRTLAARASQLAHEGGPARALVQMLPRVDLPDAALVNANTPADLQGRSGG